MLKIHVLLLAFLSGILLSLPWIVPGQGWILLVAFIPLLFASECQRKNAKFSFFGIDFLLPFGVFLIWNLLATWWIAYVSFSGMLFIASANALLMALAWWGASKIKQVSNVSGSFVLVVFWICFDFLSHKGMLPWPWLVLGNGFVNSPQLIQWYEFTGVLGGSLWIMLSNVMGYHVVAYLLRKQEKSGLLLLAGWVVLVGLPMWFSFNLYNKYPLDSGKFLNVVVLQPDVDPYTEKFSGLSYESQVQLLDSLMVSAITDKTELILAPETALPEMDEDSISSNKLLNRLAKSLHNYPKTSLIIGAITNKSSDFGVSIEGNPIKSYNSAILINSSSEAQVSHKTILVAGVEKQPFHEYFSFLPSILLSVGGDTRALEAGVKPVVLKTKSGGEIAPVICFESVFGDYVRTIVGDGANCIAVLTNDGWWKASSGVWQHFGYSGIRAIENRRSVVRSANTGISGCFNPRGDEIVKSFTGTNCTLSCAVELNNQLTFYVVHGDYLGWGSLLLSILVITHALVIKQKKSALIRM